MKIPKLVIIAAALLLLISCGNNSKKADVKKTTAPAVQTSKTAAATNAAKKETAAAKPAATETKTEKPAETPKPIPKLTVEPKDNKEAVPFNTSISSVDFARNVTIGWNLGNTLDATGNSGLNSETSWGAPKTTQAMIHGIKTAGFKSIRIPISWSKHVISEDCTIDPQWIARVKQIVDWAYNEGLYVIINIHHDNYSITELSSRNGGFAVTPDPVLQAKSKAFISAVWTQVAANFNNSYDEHLIFEILNEPRDINGKIWGNEWWLNSNNAVNAQKIITEYEKVGIDAIRESGGNNANRFIMVPDYAASSDYGTILNNYYMPKDTANDKLILSVHAYSPYTFAMYDGSKVHEKLTDADKIGLTNFFKYLNSHYINKGVGVIIGETSASNKGNLEGREEWFSFFFGEAFKYGMPCFIWDNMVSEPNPKDSEKHGYYHRATSRWYFPTLIENAMKAVGVKDYNLPKYE